jgi:hypothetical protein
MPPIDEPMLLTDVPIALRQMRDAFVDCLSDYERLRTYVTHVLGDARSTGEITSAAGILIGEVTPEFEGLMERYLEGQSLIRRVLRNEADDVDEYLAAEFEDALGEGAPWAIEAQAERAGTTDAD